MDEGDRERGGQHQDGEPDVVGPVHRRVDGAEEHREQADEGEARARSAAPSAGCMKRRSVARAGLSSGRSGLPRRRASRAAPRVVPVRREADQASDGAKVHARPSIDDAPGRARGRASPPAHAGHQSLHRPPAGARRRRWWRRRESNPRPREPWRSLYKLSRRISSRSRPPRRPGAGRQPRSSLGCGRSEPSQPYPSPLSDATVPAADLPGVTGQPS